MERFILKFKFKNLKLQDLKLHFTSGYKIEFLISKKKFCHNESSF